MMRKKQKNFKQSNFLKTNKKTYLYISRTVFGSDFIFQFKCVKLCLFIIKKQVKEKNNFWNIWNFLLEFNKKKKLN